MNDDDFAMCVKQVCNHNNNNYPLGESEEISLMMMISQMCVIETEKLIFIIRFSVLTGILMID